MQKNTPEMQENTATPQQEATPQEPNTQANQSAFNSSVERDELETLKTELQNLDANKKQDFAKFLAENMTPEEKEQFFENEEAFYQNLLDKQEQFLSQRFGDKVNRARELEGIIAQKNTFEVLERAENEFLKRNPNADIDSMMDFYENDIAPRERKKLDNLPPDEFFESLYQVFSAKTQTLKEKELPKRTKGAAMDVENADYQSEDGYFDRL